MSLTTTIPTRTTENDAVVCNYFASANPIIIKCERKDFAVVDTQDDGSGKTQINITGTLPTLTVGGYIYAAIDSITAGLWGKYTILSATASTIVIDLAFSSAFTGGYVNLITDRANYFVYTRIRAAYPTFPLPGGEVPYIYRKDYPDSMGIVQMNISENVSTYFTPKNEFAFDVTDEIDTNNCIEYSIEFKECWDDSLEDWSTAAYINSVNAAMQIQNTGGSCMVKHITSGVNDAALFLTDQNTERYWHGFPFDNQVLLYTDELKAFLDANPSLQLLRIEKTYTSPVATPTVTTTVLSSGGALSIFDTYRRLMIAGSYSGIIFVDVAIAYEYAPGLYQNITNYLRIYIENTIPCNPAYLTWLNSKGGWNYYCFGQRQQLGNKISSDGEFTQSFLDMQDQDTTSSFLGKGNDPYMICGSDRLEFFESQLMISLIGSPKVFMLMNLPTWVADGPKWREVKVDAGDYKTFDTGKGTNPFEIKLRLAEVFTQRN